MVHHFGSEGAILRSLRLTKFVVNLGNVLRLICFKANLTGTGLGHLAWAEYFPEFTFKQDLLAVLLTSYDKCFHTAFDYAALTQADLIKGLGHGLVRIVGRDVLLEALRQEFSEDDEAWPGMFDDLENEKERYIERAGAVRPGQAQGQAQ